MLQTNIEKLSVESLLTQKPDFQHTIHVVMSENKIYGQLNPLIVSRRNIARLSDPLDALKVLIGNIYKDLSCSTDLAPLILI